MHNNSTHHNWFWVRYSYIWAICLPALQSNRPRSRRIPLYPVVPDDVLTYQGKKHSVIFLGMEDLCPVCWCWTWSQNSCFQFFGACGWSNSEYVAWFRSQETRWRHWTWPPSLDLTSCTRQRVLIGSSLCRAQLGPRRAQPLLVWSRRWFPLMRPSSWWVGGNLGD